MGTPYQGAGPDLHGEVDRLVNAKLFEEVEEVWPDELAPHVSAAISLKRIADALTGTGPNILTAPLNQYGEGIGECIEGQFNRSGR